MAVNRTGRRKLNGLHGICRRAGFDPFGWHVLRHTFGSHAAMRGVSEDALQKWMGHEDTKMTKRYTHLAKSFLDGEATKLAESPGMVARKIREKVEKSSAKDGATQPVTDESDQARRALRVEGPKSCPGPLQGLRKSAVRPSISRTPRCKSVAERLSRAFSVADFQGDSGCKDVRADDQTNDRPELGVNLRR